MSKRNPKSIKNALNQKYYKKSISKTMYNKKMGNTTNSGTGLPSLAKS